MRRNAILICLFLLSVGLSGQIREPVKWAIAFDDLPSAVKAIVFTATIDKGWHIYDLNLPEGGPIPTSITVETIQGAELVGDTEASASPVELFDKTFNMNVRWYSNTVSFVRKFKVVDYRKFKISGELQFMACNDETCLAPERIPFSFGRNDIKHVPALENDDSQAIDSLALEEEENASDVAAFDDTPTDSIVPAVQPLKPLVGNNRVPTVPAETVVRDRPSLWAPVVDQLKELGDDTTSTTDRSLLYIFVAGLLGGLLAILTPCVWPVIPMTVSFFLKRTKSRKRAVGDALMYGLSIIVIYLAMGLLITGVFGASALNNLSTNAVFNILFFLLLVVFAISFLGAFELVLPASWTTKMDSRADSTKGLLSLFFMAFTLVLVSFSCTGPIIGTLLVQAASQGNTIGPAMGMLGFAVALAVPFALFAIFPNMLQGMPKSGGWLNTVKVTLGFLELALALKFLSVADLAYGWGVLDREVFLTLWIVLFVLAGLYFLGKIRFKHDSEVTHLTVPRLFLSIVTFAFAVYMVPGLWGAPLKAISAFAPPLYTQDFNMYDAAVHASFDDYEAGMAYAEKVGKPVLLDFTGFGCVNCRKMEAAVWTDERVKKLIDNDFILISLFVDDKTNLPQKMEIAENGRIRSLRTVGDKWSYLQREKFGANAQPYYVILDSEGLPLSPSYAFDENIAKFVRFLENGKANYRY